MEKTMNQVQKENEIQMVIVDNDNNIIVPIPMVKPHPVLMKFYQPKTLNGLKLTMKIAGQLDPVKVVSRDGLYYIYDGISRYFAAMELGWETIKVKVFDLSDSEIADKSVLGNFKTKRPYSEIIGHAEVILGILGMSQGKKRERIGDLSLGDDEFGLVGKDRFEIACEILGKDVCPTSLRRLMDVKEFEDNGDKEVKEFKLIEKLDSGEMKIINAFNVMEKYIQCKKEEGTNPLKESIKVRKGKNFVIHNKTCQDLSDIPDNSVDSCVGSPTYHDQREYPEGVDPNIIPLGLERTTDEYVQRQVEIYQGVYKKLKVTGSLFIVIADSYDKGVDCLVVEKLMVKMVESGWFCNQKIIWKKENPKPQSDNNKRLMPSYEYILHFIKDPKKFYYREFKNWKEEKKYEVKRSSKDMGMGKKRKDFSWTLVKPIERFRNFIDEQQFKNIIFANGFSMGDFKEIDPTYHHMAPYPSYIPVLPILMSTKVGDTVLDIYNGSSTTTAVALQLGRKAIGYDTDTKACEFADKRLSMVENNLPPIQEVVEFEQEFMSEPDSEKLAA